MTTVSSSAFRNTFVDGINLRDQDLKDALVRTAVSPAELSRSDINGDGFIRGRQELDSAFKIVDGVDRDGNANSFLDVGDAGRLYRAMLAAKAPAPYHGVEIARAARDRVSSDGSDYAFDLSPTSPLAGLSGNTNPGVTRPAWLAEKNKCNQFVGDALTQAGVQAPTVQMADGSLHYARAETWPLRADLFNRVTSVKDIREGDVIMRDDTSRTGGGTAHIEVVTGVNPMRTTGAHDTGAYEESTDWLAGAAYTSVSQTWIRGNDEIYILRPKKQIGE